ncbi:MAG: A/G-specific adenine glycosylase [Xenococcaceae cyanobacterium]
MQLHTHSEPKYFNKYNLKWFRRRIKAWAKNNLRDFPWRRTKDPYAILVAEILLQKTNAPKVVPFYQKFIKKYPTLSALAGASVSEIAELLKPLGLHYRAFRLHQSMRLLLEEPAYGGKIPSSEEKLRSLPGVGKYTARSICANAFDQPVAVLDTNVARILERFFGLRGERRVKSRDRRLWEAAQQAAPKTNVRVWNLALIDFGAAICTARKPRCQSCPLRHRCDYFVRVRERV